jgi:hypothetical protein
MVKILFQLCSTRRSPYRAAVLLDKVEATTQLRLESVAVENS